MLLRVSGQVQGQTIELDAVTQGTRASSGVPAEVQLIEFVEAAFEGSARLPATRDGLAAEVGEDGLVDAAAAVGNFSRQVRIADGTGLALDGPIAMLTVDMRERLGLDAYPSSENTKAVGRLGTLVGRLMQPLVPTVMKLFAPRDRGRRS